MSLPSHFPKTISFALNAQGRLRCPWRFCQKPFCGQSKPPASLVPPRSAFRKTTFHPAVSLFFNMSATYLRVNSRLLFSCASVPGPIRHPNTPTNSTPPRPNQKNPASSAHCPALVSKVVLLFGFCFPRLPGCCRSTAGHLPRHRCGGRAPALGIHHKVFDPSSLCFYS